MRTQQRSSMRDLEGTVVVNPRFAISADSLTIAQRLREIPPGGFCSYADLTLLIRRNVQTEARFCITSARRILQREEQMLFAPIRGQGLRRLTDEEITRLGPASIRRVNRASHRGSNQLVCVRDYSSLPSDAKTRHNAALSLLRVFYEVSTAKSVRRVEGVVSQLKRDISVKDALNAVLTEV